MEARALKTLPRPIWRSPLETCLHWSADLSKLSAAGWLAPIWLILFLIDGATGRYVSLNGLYLLPLCATAWCLGTAPALVSGGIAIGATLWLNGFGDGLSAEASAIALPVAAWNAGMRIFSVIFIVMLLSAFRRVFDREKADARVDSLTKLNNRRAFEIECRRLAMSCARDGRVMLCGLIDVDSFKSINDQYGHNAGDAVLIVLADALANAVRTYDATARLGGDEFAFCLAVRNNEVATQKTLDIHSQISAALAAGRWPASCSLGASTGDGVEDTFSRADGLLYAAKTAGKNKWRFSSLSVNATHQISP